ncbi:MAG: DUF1549 domain-containing protein [Planctomycetaceae bacterium]
MIRATWAWLAWSGVFAAANLGLSVPVWAADPLRAAPQAIELTQPEATQQVVVLRAVEGRERDVTREANLRVENPQVATVDREGLVQPVADGTTRLIIQADGAEMAVPIAVKGLTQPAPLSFEHDIEPILTKGRCNSGGCHGKAEGQNGFKLSLLGFDAEFDHDALTREARNRRLNTIDPARSLVVRKGAAEVPHGGGRKLEKESPQYRRLVRWIASGAPLQVDGERPVVQIEVDPPELTLTPGESRQLRVTAIDARGGRKCVTIESDFLSNAGHVVEADPRGVVRASDIPGEAAILVRYQGLVSVCRVALPRPNPQFQRPAEKGFIDTLVWNKLQRLGIQPSPLADDASFLRRVTLDVIGTLPTGAEARAFLQDPDPNKRAKWIDSLLQRPEYADYWAMKWTDLLRADKTRITPQGTVGLSRWLHRQFAENRPYDQLVRDVLLVQGPVQSESPAGFYKALEKPEVAARSFSQLFLGVRIECAQCHHHPSEKWSQDDYAGLVGFFTGVSVKPLPEGTEAVVSRGGADAPHPRTGQPVAARPLGAPAPDLKRATDRRRALADWTTAPDNAFLARAIANRLWAHYFGRGLVEPIDDLRATNPATNEPLLDALAQHLRDVKYDLKAFTKTLLNSTVYQLSSETNDTNATDRQHFSHAVPKALPAEVLLDAVSQTTGIAEKFNGWPEGIRAIQVWDNRMPSYFFRIFGRPVRATVCECERSNEPSISQALHLMNSPEIQEKLTHRKGQARRLALGQLPPEQVAAELYLATLSRLPTETERPLIEETFAVHGSDRQAAVEDLLWALLNTKEFLYNH